MFNSKRSQIVAKLISSHAEIVRFLNALGNNNPSVLGYHFPFYRDMLIKIGVGKPVYLGAYLDDKLVGLLPSFSFQSSVGVVYNSLPFFGPNSGVLCNADEFRFEVHAVLFHALFTRALQDKALCCVIYTPFLFNEFDLYDSFMPDALVVERFTQYMSLVGISFEHGTRGNDARRAVRSGVTISKEVTRERIDVFYNIYEQNCMEFGIPQKPKECIVALTHSSIVGRFADIFFAVHENRLIGGLLVLRSPLTASYYLPCTLTSARALQPGSLLIHYAISKAQSCGLQFWNWESSPSRESGVYRFKEKWGAVESKYRIYVKLLQPGDVFNALGRQGILRHFPNYFVYPFDRLMN